MERENPQEPCLLTDYEPGSPLWQRVPTRDEKGRPVSDFMMLIPGLRERPTIDRLDRINSMNCLLQRYRHVVLYADLNLKLNLLWVSVRPVPGICLELPAALKVHIPEAVLVGEKLRTRR